MLDIDTSGANESYNKAEFLSYDLGEHRIRLLTEPRRVFLHYLRGKGTIECLGSDCPICQKNKLIASTSQAPEKEPGYNRSSLRYYFNGLDRTLVKICPNCQTPNKKGSIGFLPVCSECGAVITDIQEAPLDRVKIVNVSKTNAELLRTIQASTLNAENQPLGLENFDVIFKVFMVEKQKNIIVDADPTANDKVEVPEDALFDLERITIKLEPDEMESLVSGVSLKDIFAARRGDDFSEDLEKFSEETEEKVAQLFDN